MTAAVVSKLEDAFKHGATVTEACYLSGVSRDTFYKHYQADKEFSDKMELARSWLSTIAKHNLAAAIEGGDIKASVWLLEKHVALPVAPISTEIPEEITEQSLDDYVKMVEKLVQARMQRRMAQGHSAVAGTGPTAQVEQHITP